jgi:peptidylglycine monooxygenase
MKKNNQRRSFLKKTVVITAGAIAGFNIIGKANPNQNDIIGHGTFKYKVNKTWGNLDASKTPVLNCHEMVQDSKGRLLMIGDDVRNNILVYDKSGKLLDYWGSAYRGGHGLTLSAEGEEDFLFIADCGYYLGKDGKWHAQAGSIYKTTINGDLVFALGHPATIGVYKKGEKFQPTEIAVAPNGDFYVADGYGSDYIIQYNHDGKYIRHFGGHNNANPEHNLNNAHGVAVDMRNPSLPKLICTSRNDNAFKFFTLDGKYLETIKLPGAYVCRPVINGENIYAGVCWSNFRDSGKMNSGKSGFVTILDKNNKVVSNPGGTSPVYTNGVLQPMFMEGEIFYHGHDVCVDDEKNIYVCQWNADKTYPVKLERV